MLELDGVFFRRELERLEDCAFETLAADKRKFGELGAMTKDGFDGFVSDFLGASNF